MRATVVTRAAGAFVFTAGMSIDADGCPRAYGPPGCPIDPLDDLACAGRPGHWYGLACNDDGDPYVQGPDDPAPGCYVSQTALGDHTRPLHDPRRYVDALLIPYIAVPPELHKVGVNMGDLAVVLYAGLLVGAIVAEIGPSNHYGEGSMALARELGILESPRHGGVSGRVQYVIFEDSRATPAWPRDPAEFQPEAERRYRAWMRR